MKALFYLMLEVNVYFTLFYLVYLLVIKKNTFFKLNRCYLLFTVGLSFFLPYLEFPSLEFLHPVNNVILPDIWIYTGNSHTIPSSTIFNWNWIIYLYIICLITMLTKFSLCLFQLLLLIQKTSKRANKQYIHLTTINNLPSFSFFKYLHLSNNDFENRAIIKAHELVHIKQYHSLDNLLYELFYCFSWFNPLVKKAQQSLKTTHEFLADEGVLKTYSDKTYYSNLLLHRSLKFKPIALTNLFFYKANLKIRINMIYKNRSTKKQLLSYVLILPLVLGIVSFNACTKPKEDSSTGTAQKTADEAYTNPDQMPSFKGGQNGLFQFLGENIKYPEKAKDEEIQGKVMTEFIVDEQGRVSNIKIIQSVRSDIDEETLRVLNKMPNWNPGSHQGKYVKTKFTLPVNFMLK